MFKGFRLIQVQRPSPKTKSYYSLWLQNAGNKELHYLGGGEGGRGRGGGGAYSKGNPFVETHLKSLQKAAYATPQNPPQHRSAFV